jgi:hypothetical protein
MAINSFLPGGQSSTNVDYGFDNSMFGRIASLDSFSASGLMSLFASQPQYVVKAESGDVAFQSMLEIGADESSSLPEEPIEAGSFAQYNRVHQNLTNQSTLCLLKRHHHQYELCQEVRFSLLQIYLMLIFYHLQENVSLPNLL